VRAVEIAQPGGPDVLRVVDRPTPEPRDGEVLIRVAGAGVNRPDILQRLGKYPPPPGASDLPGLEVSGTVVATSGRTRWREGDRVCALLAGGGYAEFAVAPAPQCLPAPPAIDLVEAGAIPETFFTVWTNVFERGKLQAGETILIHGGSSGIGTTAIQLARAFGATVFATAGSAEKCAACERLGATRAINYKTEDFVGVSRELTGGRGVNVILDMVGGDYLPRNLDALAVEGRLIQIGLLGGAKSTINLATLMQKRQTLTGSTLRIRSVEQKGAIAQALERDVWPLFENGRVRPVVHRVLTLEEAAEAHRLLEAGDVIGKLVLAV
jgi:putative PIG3 family NAD(P)H quinone oxidoreductase